jgi:uncharacterized protein YabE (DUF348 family)
MKLVKWGKRQNIYAGSIFFLGISILISYYAYITALNQVVLNVDGKSYLWKTLSTNVAGALQEKRIPLNNGDVVRPALTTNLRGNTKIEVIRAFPVAIVKSGEIFQVNTISQSVGDLLQQACVKVNPEDKVVPGLDTVVSPHQKIRIIQVTNTIITRRVILQPATEYRKDKNLERGVQKTFRVGEAGLAERRIKVIYEDGRETRHEVVAEKIIKQMVSSIVLVGIKPVIRTLYTSRGSFRYIEVKTMKATAYYPGPESCGKYAVYGETYTGKKAGFGYVAVDPKVIKLGTKLYIEGYGKAEAADIGSAIKGNRIDLCYETFREAAMYGVKKIKVYILFE